MEEYSILANMSTMTKPTEEDKGTFLFMTSNLTHEPLLLQAPEYVPMPVVDNAEYDAVHADRFKLNGRTMIVEEELQMVHYHTNIAALQLLADWFDYLRSNDLYDNTRIILVADHGRMLYMFDEFDMGSVDLAGFYPLLMVKDFNSTGFSMSDDFMTTADVPTLAVQDIIESPVNPFTGKKINNSEKTAHEQFVVSTPWETTENNGNTFLPGQWLSVKDDIWDRDNWTMYEGKHILSEHKAP